MTVKTKPFDGWWLNSDTVRVDVQVAEALALRDDLESLRTGELTPADLLSCSSAFEQLYREINRVLGARK